MSAHTPEVLRDWYALWRGSSCWRITAVGADGLRRIVLDGAEGDLATVRAMVAALNGLPAPVTVVRRTATPRPLKDAVMF